MPPKRPNLPAELFNMKSLSAAGEEVEEEEEEEEGKAAERKEDKDEENSAAEMIIDASEGAEAAQLNGKNSSESNVKREMWPRQNYLVFLKLLY